MRYFLWILIVIVSLIVLATVIVLSHPKFGHSPSEVDQQSFNTLSYYDGNAFQNIEPTEMLIKGESTAKIFFDDFFKDLSSTRPINDIPTVKTDLKKLDIESDLMIWLGHSSFYLQLEGKKILIDPILSDYASPFSFANKAFNGTTLYSAEDMPEIDLVLISHDHWDHLDYTTMVGLKNKIKRIIAPLGIDSHLLHWGYDKKQIKSLGWNKSYQVDDDFLITVLPAKHYSGRLFERNKTLWASFSVKSKNHNLFFSGDSGYGSHFKTIASQLGPFDLVMLDSGQYDERWPNIHMTPKEAIQATIDLKSSKLFPIHIGRLAISTHAWNEPFSYLDNNKDHIPFTLIMPKIGDVLFLDQLPDQFDGWWKRLF